MNSTALSPGKLIRCRLEELYLDFYNKNFREKDEENNLDKK